MSRGRSPKLRINREVEILLAQALAAAELKNCSVEPEHQEAMRLYLDTWVVARLRLALRSIRGEVASQELRRIRRPRY